MVAGKCGMQLLLRTDPSELSLVIEGACQGGRGGARGRWGPGGQGMRVRMGTQKAMMRDHDRDSGRGERGVRVQVHDLRQNPHGYLEAPSIAQSNCAQGELSVGLTRNIVRPT